MATLAMEFTVLSYVVTAFACITFALNVDYTFSSTIIADRLPLYAPDKCKDPNQMLFPEGNDTWICDCGPGFVYYDVEDACFLPYRQGPCQKGHHLLYFKETRNSKCVKNPCEDGFAKYNDVCYELSKPGPCKKTKDGPKIFDVNSTTLEVDCLEGTEKLYLFDIPKICSPGSRRDSSGSCREQI